MTFLDDSKIHLDGYPHSNHQYFTGRDTIPPYVSCPEHQTRTITGQDQQNVTVNYDPLAQATDNIVETT